MRQAAASIVLALLCAFAQGGVRAQGLNDPMQPSGRTADARSSAPAAGGLQVVITSPSRNLAVIDGVVVPLGAATRNGTLSSVSESVAVVRKNGERDVLLMHPDIDKKPARGDRP